MIKLTNFLLKQLDVAVCRHSSLERLKRDRDDAILRLEQFKSRSADLGFLLSMPRSQILSLIELLAESKAQIRQDLFVLCHLDFKKDGFFVEFGATNGIEGSNTYLLERKFGWKGILAEPARCWEAQLQRNRTCLIDKRCVWRKSGEYLDFREAELSALSTIASFADVDCHRHARSRGHEYRVETVSLVDLLIEHEAPENIDYLSLDTEGSEFEILRDFDFDRFRFKVITCEHNYSIHREAIHSLLVSRGYKRQFQNISDFDDWYVCEG